MNKKLLAKAKKFVADYTGQVTPLKSLLWFNQQMGGENKLAEMVAEAMDLAAKEVKESLKGEKKDVQSE